MPPGSGHGIGVRVCPSRHAGDGPGLDAIGLAMQSAPRSRRIRARRSGRRPSTEILDLSSAVQQRLRHLLQTVGPYPFAGRRVGVEKESLRVDRAGYISQQPHPAALGSALTHSTITTDFSEALLEFVTPAYRGVRETNRSLRHLHQFTYPLIGDDVLWATSMPCMVTGDRSIPIARYGSSNVGTMKHVYRCGLSHRYGRVMQIISGVHFNFSCRGRSGPHFARRKVAEENAWGLSRPSATSPWCATSTAADGSCRCCSGRRPRSAAPSSAPRRTRSPSSEGALSTSRSPPRCG